MSDKTMTIKLDAELDAGSLAHVVGIDSVSITDRMFCVTLHPGAKIKTSELLAALTQLAKDKAREQ